MQCSLAHKNILATKMFQTLFSLPVQVFQFPGVGEDRASLSLGHMLVPGVAPGYFCKPAAVAVETSGVFYVADG